MSFVPRKRFNLLTQPPKDRLSGGSENNGSIFNKEDLANLIRHKSPAADLRSHYRRTLEFGFIATLAFLILGFQLARTFDLKAKSVEQVDVTIEVQDIPVTQQFRRPPPSPRPSIPIPTDEEAVPEDLTISSTNLDLTEIPPPPPPRESDDEGENIFVAYDEPPEIIGGMSALLYHLNYPPLARKSGVECTVVAKIYVTKSGESKKVEILKVSAAGFGFERSAVQALKKVRWKPAKQRDRAISTWVAVPVKFELTN